MKVTAINISVFDLLSNTALFDLEEVPYGRRTRWQRRGHGRAAAPTVAARRIPAAPGTGSSPRGWARGAA